MDKVSASGWRHVPRLRSLGLGQYEAAFRENEIDETVLPNLTAEDLKDLGVDPPQPHSGILVIIGKQQGGEPDGRAHRILSG